MPRIRTIKPEFFQHEKLYDAEIETGLPLRVAFAGLWTVADREGRFEWRPRMLKLCCLPYDDVDFSRVLHALATRGFLVHYASQGREYGAIPGFQRHQVVNNREKQSELPEPTENIEESDACPTREGNAQGERKGKERKGRGKEGKGEKETPNGVSKKGTRLPENWVPSETIIQWASGEGFPEQAIQDQLDRFRDYWIAIPGAKGCKLDWNATFRNWLRRSTDLNGKPAANGHNGTAQKQPTWRHFLPYCRQNKFWPAWNEGLYGPKPGEPGCIVPPEFLQDGDGRDWRLLTEDEYRRESENWK